MRFDNHHHQDQATPDLISQSRHETNFHRYLDWLDQQKDADPAARQITIIARSPHSPVILAMCAMRESLRARQICVQVVFSDVDPEKALRYAWNVISDLSKDREHGDLIRWASSHGILEAHEQMVLGQKMCWLGDAMRREPGRRDGFDVFDADAPQTCKLSIQSFAAMWKYATPVPNWMLREASERRPNATFAGPDQRSLATLSFFRQLEKSGTFSH